jgi:hypothetical protein
MAQHCAIYDKLNCQPNLQDIIKQFYYDNICKENQRKNHAEVIDILNYCFKNVREHQQLYHQVVDEDYILEFMLEEGNYYELTEKNKFYGFKNTIEFFYGDDWLEYREYAYDDYYRLCYVNGYD